MKPPQSYSFRSIYSRVRAKITQSYFFRSIYPRVRTRITPNNFRFIILSPTQRTSKSAPRFLPEKQKTRTCINPYAQITPMSPRESASEVPKHISSESIRYPIVTTGIHSKTYIKCSQIHKSSQSDKMNSQSEN